MSSEDANKMFLFPRDPHLKRRRRGRTEQQLLVVINVPGRERYTQQRPEHIHGVVFDYYTLSVAM